MNVATFSLVAAYANYEDETLFNSFKFITLAVESKPGFCEQIG